MPTYLPEPRFTAPELFYPHRKPANLVGLDRSHPLFRHIVMSVPLGSGGFYDYAASALLQPTGDVQWTPAGVDFGSGESKLSLDRPFPVGSEFTILLRIRAHSIGNNGGIASDKNNGNWNSEEGVSLSMRATGGLLFRVAASMARTEDPLFADLGWHDVALTWQAGQSQQIFVDGVEANYSSAEIASAYVGSSADFRLGAYYTESVDRSLDGEMAFIIGFNKRLTENQRRDVFNNPYQFYTPLC